ncbi:MAG: glycerol-3-phosphate acyltransferase, partial [Desulfobacterales bacterium]|nr:glycerol-3-phosphate acyltransferase [Desulfobacterales bacterium]
MSLFAPIKNLVSATRRKIRNLIAFLLNYSYDYYSNFYPGTQSFIIRKILNHLVDKISIDNNSLDRIKNTAANSIVVFACKNKHVFDFLYFHTLLRPMNGPYPELSFDLRFFFL